MLAAKALSNLGRPPRPLATVNLGRSGLSALEIAQQKRMSPNLILDALGVPPRRLTSIDMG